MKAFPANVAKGQVIVDEGMTLRDYFAAHAPSPPTQWIDDSINDGKHYAEAEASWRYFYADAMMEARKGE